METVDNRGLVAISEAIDFSEFEDGRYINYWELDPTIQRELERVYTEDEFDWAQSRLREFGAVVGETIVDNADYIDEHGPELEPYTRYGEIQNFVHYPSEQYENERLTYESGIVADSFRAPPGRSEPMPFTHNLAMLYLLTYAEGGLGCPVAMTAGAALVLEKFDDGTLDAYYEAMITREFEDLIEGAMFLTEEQGGSDVGANETMALYDEESGFWRLYGEKWFCSNIDAEGTLILARTEGAPSGTDGLSLFLVPHSDPGSEEPAEVVTKGNRKAEHWQLDPEAVNDQYYRRLKDKLGTISVPTGEVELDGAKAYLVGEEENGFKQMAEMLNLERLSNATGACGMMGRAMLENRIQAATREAFGKPLNEHPLMQADLVNLTVEHEAATAFTFEAARLFSERERARRNGESASHAYKLMRLLIPIAKLRTGRMAVEMASYTMEIQGGNGYVDDFFAHRMLRDAQVLPIWEGTENVLSLDVLRALAGENSHEAFVEAMEERLERISHPALTGYAETVETEFEDLREAMLGLVADEEYAQLSAKRLAHYIFDVFTAAILLEKGQDAIETDNDGRAALVAQRFVETYLRESKARGLTDGSKFALEYFEPIVHFEPIDSSTLHG